MFEVGIIMVQVLEKLDSGKIKVVESMDLSEIKDVLEYKLFVPDPQVRSKIIDELLSYLGSKFESSEYKLKVFIAYRESETCGFVICQIDPYYTSYSRKCGTFGWLNTDSLKICKLLIRECELFVKENRIRKIRGNINFPKNLGGIGIQFMGFEEQMLYGVAYNDPNSRILNYF